MAYVLIVDDDEDFTNATSMVLQQAGHETRVMLDTSSAVKSMEEKTPDLILLDVMFPENSSAGFELARSIREYEGELKNVPILMLTAVNQKFPLGFSATDIDEQWLPVQMFLEKPVDLEVLQSKVAEIIAKDQKLKTDSAQ